MTGCCPEKLCEILCPNVPKLERLDENVEGLLIQQRSWLRGVHRPERTLCFH